MKISNCYLELIKIDEKKSAALILENKVPNSIV